MSDIRSSFRNDLEPRLLRLVVDHLRGKSRGENRQARGVFQAVNDVRGPFSGAVPRLAVLEYIRRLGPLPHRHRPPRRAQGPDTPADVLLNHSQAAPDLRERGNRTARILRERERHFRDTCERFHMSSVVYRIRPPRVGGQMLRCRVARQFDKGDRTWVRTVHTLQTNH